MKDLSALIITTKASKPLQQEELHRQLKNHWTRRHSPRVFTTHNGSLRHTHLKMLAMHPVRKVQCLNRLRIGWSEESELAAGERGRRASRRNRDCEQAAGEWGPQN